MAGGRTSSWGVPSAAQASGVFSGDSDRGGMRAGRRDERRPDASRPPGPSRAYGVSSQPSRWPKRTLRAEGLKEAPSPRAPAASPERPLGSRLEYPINGAGNRRDTRLGHPITRRKMSRRPVSGG
jgi:hypothetical protein